jgi:hypothetical protein
VKKQKKTTVMETFALSNDLVNGVTERGQREELALAKAWSVKYLH